MAGFSAWAGSGHSAARLIAAGPDATSPNGSTERAGIEIRLDPGYITYWRNPGDAGLPPTIDTSRSENVAAVVVDYPAPQKLDEGGTEAFGYADGVTLPLHVTPIDRSQPSTLAADLDYAVCATLCLPAKARMRVPLPRLPVTEASALLDAAAARVPRTAALGAPGHLSIDAVAAEGAVSDLRVKAHAGPSATLFVEAPEGWYLQARAGVSSAGGAVTFPVAVLQRPADARQGPIPIRMTLVDPAGAIDVITQMDVGTPAP